MVELFHCEMFTYWFQQSRAKCCVLLWYLTAGPTAVGDVFTQGAQCRCRRFVFLRMLLIYVIDDFVACLWLRIPFISCLTVALCCQVLIIINKRRHVLISPICHLCKWNFDMPHYCVLIMLNSDSIFPVSGRPACLHCAGNATFFLFLTLT